MDHRARVEHDLRGAEFNIAVAFAVADSVAGVWVTNLG